MFEEKMKKEGIYLSNITEFTSIEAIKQCVKLDIGLAVLPELTVQAELSNGELASIKIANEFPAADTYLVYHKDKDLPGYMQSFIELVLDCY
jgi:DNA-binding transcriptional LysR family regulator